MSQHSRWHSTATLTAWRIPSQTLVLRRACRARRAGCPVLRTKVEHGAAGSVLSVLHGVGCAGSAAVTGRRRRGGLVYEMVSVTSCTWPPQHQGAGGLLLPGLRPGPVQPGGIHSPNCAVSLPVLPAAGLHHCPRSPPPDPETCSKKAQRQVHSAV